MSNVRIPGYKVLSQLGKGGMSSVYLAEQLSFGRLVALKVMTANLAETEHFGHRFERETRIAAQLSHPNIVSVYDTGFVDGNYFLAMEYLQGGDLRKRIGTGIALLESLDITMAMADAIDYASSQGVIHRDIKPGNIMFRENGSLAMVDFGIAKDTAAGTNVTQVGTVLGTPHYMSPEQCLGEELDGRSDLYSLGIVMFELLSGHVPFTADSAAAIGVRHISDDVPLLPEETRIFQDIINIILAKSPDERYQSGEEFVADIEELRQELPQELQTTILLSKPQIARSGSTSSLVGSSRSRARRRRLRARPRGIKQQVSDKAVAIGAVVATVVLGALLYQYMGLSFLQRESRQSPTEAEVAMPSENVEMATGEPVIDANPPKADAAGLAEDSIALENTARLYILKARNALSEGRIDSAESYIELSQGLQIDSRGIRMALAELIADSEDLRMELGRLDGLVRSFADQLELEDYYSPPATNAYQTLNQLRLLSPQYPKLSTMQRKLDSAVSKSIRQTMSQGQLEQAGKQLALLEKVGPVGVVSQLEGELGELKRNRDSVLSRQRQWHAKAQLLKQSTDNTVDRRRDLITTYQQLLRLDSSDKVARDGLATTLSSELEAAKQGLKMGQLVQAREMIDYLKAQAPGLEGLAATSAELQRLESRRREAEANRLAATIILENVRGARLSVKTSHAIHMNQANELIRAYRAVYKARQLAPTLSGIDSVLNEIDLVYTDRFTAYANREGVKIAGIYADVLSSSRLDAPHILALVDDFNKTLEGISTKRTKSFPSF